jgi:hypothetical protein
MKPTYQALQSTTRTAESDCRSRIAARMPHRVAAARRPSSLRRLSRLAVEVDETLHTPQQGGRHLACNERAVVNGDAGGDRGHVESVERIDRDLDASRVTGVAFGREEY